jgi:hypothetical protein
MEMLFDWQGLIVWFAAWAVTGVVMIGVGAAKEGADGAVSTRRRTTRRGETLPDKEEVARATVGVALVWMVLALAAVAWYEVW